MLVKCIRNKPGSDNKKIVKKYSGLYSNLEDSVKVGEYYIVFGITFDPEIVFYDLMVHPNDDFPLTFPATAFEMVDSRISRFFHFGGRPNPDGNTYPYISFEERVKDYSFFENLVDWGEKETIVFEKYRELLILEFRTPDIKKTAQIVENKQLMCPNCNEKWTQKLDLEMCRCPKCKTILLSPL